MIDVMLWHSNGYCDRVQARNEWTIRKERGGKGDEGFTGRNGRNSGMRSRKLDDYDVLTWLSFRCLAHSSFDIPAARPPLVLPPGTLSSGL